MIWFPFVRRCPARWRTVNSCWVFSRSKYSSVKFNWIWNSNVTCLAWSFVFSIIRQFLFRTSMRGKWKNSINWNGTIPSRPGDNCSPINSTNFDQRTESSISVGANLVSSKPISKPCTHIYSMSPCSFYWSIKSMIKARMITPRISSEVAM